MATERHARRAVGLITSRSGPMGLVIIIGVALLALFAIVSVYFAIVSSGNPAAIMMVLFFIVPLGFILTYETNAFPDLPHRKIKSLVAFYITGLFVIPIVGTLFVSFNVALILMLIIFGIPFAIAIIHLATTEDNWFSFKEGTHEKFSNAGSRIKEPISHIRRRVKKEPKRRLRRNR